MVRELVHDPILLGRPSAPAGQEDQQTVQDLVDTLNAHRDSCVGMAANMIGVHKQIIVFLEEGQIRVMRNPRLLSASGAYETQEGCLSLLGGPRNTRRFQKIKVQWDNERMQPRIRTFTGWTAQIIQHEMDHCQGILI